MSTMVAEREAVQVRQKIKVTLLEDKPQDLKPLVDNLDAAEIFDVETHESLLEVDFIGETEDSLIISLDLEVDSRTKNSVNVAKEILRLNPYRGIFFYTYYPKQVENGPLNFILNKKTGFTDFRTPRIKDIFAQLSLRILIHDICLAALKKMTGDFILQDLLTRDYIARDVRGGAENLYTSLDWAIQFFENSDPDSTLRYRELEPVLRSIINSNSNDVLGGGHHARRPLLETVLAEQAHLRQVKNRVIPRKGLKDEIDNLKKLIIGQAPHDPLYSEERIDEFEDAGAVEVVNPELEAGVESQEEMIYEPDVASAEDTEYEAAAWHLNIWFRDFYDEAKPLVVGQTAILEVNIGPPRNQGTTLIPRDESSLLYNVDYVDALVLCSGADVSPLSCRLNLPPEQDSKPAEFEVTPRGPGIFDLTVLLLRKNDPIFETGFKFTVVEATPDTL